MPDVFPSPAPPASRCTQTDLLGNGIRNASANGAVPLAALCLQITKALGFLWKPDNKVIRFSLSGRDSTTPGVATAFSSARLFWLMDECTQQMVSHCYVNEEEGKLQGGISACDPTVLV